MTIGCMRAKMGSTVYYICKMAAGELVEQVYICSAGSAGGLKKSITGRDMKKMINESVPDVIRDPARFSRGVILDIYTGFDDVSFAPLSQIVGTVPDAYSAQLKDMGTLTLPGDKQLIALDGQNDLLTLKIAIQGIKGIPVGVRITKEMYELRPHPELAKEELCVIFARHEDAEKIKRGLSLAGSWEKTSRSKRCDHENLTAIVTRRLFQDGGPLAPVNSIELVNWKNGSLPERSKALTTEAALTNVTEILLDGQKDLTAAEEAYQLVASFWDTTLGNLSAYHQYLALTRSNKPVSALRKDNLLFKPVTQAAIAYAAHLAQQKGISWDAAAKKLDGIGWSINNRLWHDILCSSDAKHRMLHGRKTIQNAGTVIFNIIMSD